MKSMNSATPASREPGPSSLGIIISESRSTIGYSSAKKNRGVYVALLICWTPFAAACTGSQANAHLLNPANPAAAEAVAKILNISRRSIPCPAINSQPSITASKICFVTSSKSRRHFKNRSSQMQKACHSEPSKGRRRISTSTTPQNKRHGLHSPQTLHTLRNQLLRRLMRISAPAVFNRAVPSIPGRLQNSKRLCQINRIIFPVLLEISILHMTNPISMLKHRRNRAVRKVHISAHHRIREIGQCMQIRIIHAFDDLDDEERILADKIVVLHVYDDVS